MRKDRILSFVNSSEYTPMSKENIAVLLCVPRSDMDEFYKIIDELTKEGSIIEGKKKRLFSAKKIGVMEGIFRGNSGGFGFVTNDEGDIYIPCEYVNGALNGDSVLVKIKKNEKSVDKKREGSIIRITSRANRTIVGIYTQERGYGILTPDSDKLPDEIFVPQHLSGGALNGQKVVCEIKEYETSTSSLCCRVKEILGFPYDFGVDVLSVIKSYECPLDFSKEALLEAEAVDKIEESDLKERLDLTDKIIFTIDGEDTKDIDDAISVEKTEDGFLLGVHIADVSHYVKPSSSLDKEAYARGTSVYLADRVIPMLPVRLSNGICSLNEGVLRLTMSVFIEYDKNANIKNTAFYKSFIKSSAKMTYNNVRDIIEKKDSELCREYEGLLETIDNMYKLYLILREKTKERGSIDFNIPEAKAVFDKDGKTVDIVLRENSFANKIIEEFMVAANSAVAAFLSEKDAAALYRVHGEPNKERLENTLNFIYNKGCEKKGSLNDVMRYIKGKDYEAAFSAMLLRSMAKARYDVKNDGHFGLMLSDYCHFTSPIRRYPDLICHRALKAVIENDRDMKKHLKTFVADAAEKCSERENAAAMCERDTLDIKKAEYMSDYIGEQYSGVISSVTGFGFFVQLSNTVEGLVRVENLNDDYYVFDEKKLMLYGERTGRTFTIGDSVKIKVVSSNKITRRIDFALLEGGNINGRKRKEKDTRSKQKRSSRVFHRRKVRGRR